MMASGVVVVAETVKGELSDITLEALACGRRVAQAGTTSLTCVVLAESTKPFEALPLAADKVVVVADASLSGFNPEAHLRVLVPLLHEMAPRLVLAGNTPSGADMAGPLALALGAFLQTGVIALAAEGVKVAVASQLCGGKLVASGELPPGPSVVLLMPGHFPKEEGMGRRVPSVEIRAPPAPVTGLKVAFRGYEEPQAADVDLTKAPVIVGVGRGIQDKGNLDMVEELAEALGGAVGASRPVVDQGWLPRSRQVGRSGVTVKPRLYLALGISGAPEHVEGMKEAGLIVAVNTDPEAPIFDVAHVGACVDVLELVPLLMEELKRSGEKPRGAVTKGSV